jgi:glyoxylase-like metal-dependent hydrolase (beta-lactamase superfamily II)
VLRARQHGDVTEIRLTTTVLGRPLYGVSAYLFDGTLIDTGPPRTGRELAAWARGQEIEQIVNTHHHEDHVGGNAFLPHLPALAPPDTVQRLARAPRIPFYRRTTFGQPRPALASPLGERVATRCHTLQVIATPGHAFDHVVLWLPERGWLFSADLYLMERARYVRRRDDVGRWMESLRRMLAYDFDTMFCAHAGCVPEAHAALRRKLAYWEELRGECRRLAEMGYSAERIRTSLLGREGFLTYWSGGSFSKTNLIIALLNVEGAPAAA